MAVTNPDRSEDNPKHAIRRPLTITSNIYIFHGSTELFSFAPLFHTLLDTTLLPDFDFYYTFMFARRKTNYHVAVYDGYSQFLMGESVK